MKALALVVANFINKDQRGFSKHFSLYTVEVKAAIQPIIMVADLTNFSIWWYHCYQQIKKRKFQSISQIREMHACMHGQTHCKFLSLHITTELFWWIAFFGDQPWNISGRWLHWPHRSIGENAGAASFLLGQHFLNRLQVYFKMVMKSDWYWQRWQGISGSIGVLSKTYL